MITIKKLFGNQCQPQKKGQVEKFLSVIAAVSIVFLPVTPAFAADITMTVDAQWASAGGMDSSNITNAVAGDNVDLDGYVLAVTNDNVNADDGSGPDDFDIGDITDGSVVQTGAVNIYTDAAGGGTLTVTINSVDIGGGFTAETVAASGNDVDVAVAGDFSVGGGVNVTANATGGSALLTLSGANISAGSFVLNDDTNLATLELDGGANQDVTGTIDGAAAGEGTLVINAGATDTSFNGAVGAANSLLAIGLRGTGTTRFASTVAATTTTFTGATTLYLGGHLTGNIDFGGVAGTVIAADGVNIVGDVDDTGGPAGTLVFQGASTIGNAIGGAGALAAVNIGDGLTAGGIVTMGNDIFATTTTVESGGTLRLNANRTITGNLTLADSLGAGNGGTLDVGTSTLTISAPSVFTMPAATRLNLTIDGTTFGSVNTSGIAAVVNAASAINITVGSRYVVNGATFNVINTGTNGVGAVPGSITDNSYALSFTGDATTGDLILTATRGAGGNAYEEASTSGNTQAVGAVFDELATTGLTGDMAAVMNTLDNMGSAEEVADALETMTPDVSSGAAEASRAITNQGFTMISNRLGGARSSGFVGTGISAGDMLNGVGVWIQGLGSHTKQDARKGIEGYKANLFGTTIGADKLIDNHFRAGLAGSYGWARVNSKTPGSPSDDINSYQATVYGSYDSLDLSEARKKGKNSREAVRNQGEDFWYVDGMAAFTENDYDSRREIWLGTTKRVAKADHNAQQYSTNFEAGYTFTFEETKKLEVTPFASIGYNYLYMNSYKEKGANALNLSVQGEGFHQLEQALGTKLAYPIVAKKMGTLIPSAKAAWLYDYIGDRFETTASFAGGGSSFSTRGAKPAKNGMLFGSELAFLNKGNMTVTGNWDIELKDQFMSNTYYGTARYDF